MKLVFDTESDALKENATVVHVISVCDLDGPAGHIESYSDTPLPGVVGTLQDGLDRLSEADELVGHNIINSDFPILKRICNWEPKPDVKIFDTLVVSRALNPDRPKPPGITGKTGPHSLEAWGYRAGKIKPAHESWDLFDPAMLRRNRSDVEINYGVYYSLIAEIGDYDWSECLELEHQVARIITQQEINGVRFDYERAIEYVRLLGDRIAAIDSQLRPLLPRSYRARGVVISEPFKVTGGYKKVVTDWYPDLSGPNGNYVCGPFTRLDVIELDLDSVAQLKEFLYTQGWVPTEWNYDDDGNPTSPKLTEDSYDSITGDLGRLIKDRLLYTHRQRQIRGWIERVRPDGRLTASANPCGTPTGRARHSNVVNVPKASPDVFFGTEMRSLFIASEGRKLVGHDADGLEIRFIAHYLGDPEFIKALVSGDKKLGTDIHSLNMKRWEMDSRDDAKTTLYALVYGAGDDKLGSIVGKDAAHGAWIRKVAYEHMPSIESLLKKVAKAAKRGWLKGLDGRKIWLRRKSAAMNSLIQSAGAIMMKKSMVLLHESVLSNFSHVSIGQGSDLEYMIDFPVKKVLDIHDEAQADVMDEYVDQYIELAEQSIVKAGEFFKIKCPLVAEAKAGSNWAETH